MHEEGENVDVAERKLKTSHETVAKKGATNVDELNQKLDEMSNNYEEKL